MIFASVPVAEAEGGLLAHSLLVGGTRWPKGRVLSAADIAAASAAGLRHLTIARLAADDVGEDAAAARLAGGAGGAGIGGAAGGAWPGEYRRRPPPACAASMRRWSPRSTASTKR